MLNEQLNEHFEEIEVGELDLREDLTLCLEMGNE